MKEVGQKLLHIRLYSLTLAVRRMNSFNDQVLDYTIFMLCMKETHVSKVATLVA